ncbi:MAG: tetratricopeptide repeat protein [Anaerolineae bacterium]|nr:tetratricopeptide repeat protein [Anaerolineae bacterium]
MAITSLTDPRSCACFFRQCVLNKLRYWQGHEAVKTLDIRILDQERTGLVRVITFAFGFDEAWPLTRELISALSPYMERRGYWDTWQWVLSRAIEAATRLEDFAGVVSLSLLLARLLQRQSAFKLAVTYYWQTMQLARRIGDEYSRARACSNLGFLYAELGHWWRAEILCCHALAVFERLDSNHGRAHTENHLGVLYIWQQRWDLARQHLERACAIWQAMGDNYGLILGFLNLGSLYDDIESPDQALFYLEKALHLAKQTGDEAQLATIYMNMSIAYKLSGRLDIAEQLLWQAEANFRRFANLIGLAQIQENLGLMFLGQRNWAEAKKHLRAALQAWKNLGNEYGKIRTLTHMVEYELAKGNRRRARRQLSELEHLINLSDQKRLAPFCQSLLAKCRRSLME